jgi:CspA family cold shock protein
MHQGTVKFWKSDRGFGFIEHEGGEDVFCHVSALVGSAQELRPGARVSFEIGTSKKTGRPAATNVRTI